MSSPATTSRFSLLTWLTTPSTLVLDGLSELRIDMDAGVRLPCRALYVRGNASVEGVRRCRALDAEVDALAEAGLIDPPDAEVGMGIRSRSRSVAQATIRRATLQTIRPCGDLGRTRFLEGQHGPVAVSTGVPAKRYGRTREGGWQVWRSHSENVLPS